MSDFLSYLLGLATVDGSWLQAIQKYGGVFQSSQSLLGSLHMLDGAFAVSDMPRDELNCLGTLGNIIVSVGAFKEVMEDDGFHLLQGFLQKLFTPERRTLINNSLSQDIIPSLKKVADATHDIIAPDARELPTLEQGMRRRN